MTTLENIGERMSVEGMHPGMDTRIDLIRDREYLWAVVKDMAAEIELLKTFVEWQNDSA